MCGSHSSAHPYLYPRCRPIHHNRSVEKDRFKVDRNAFSVISLDEQEEDEKRYWLRKTPHERLEAVELTRQILYSYDPATTRLQRVLEITTRA